MNNIQEPYPFKEGDDYWTIEDGLVVHSCWDSVSEELHDCTKIYFTSEEKAVEYLNELNKQFKPNNL